jgi:hypothetical protein
MQTKEQRVKEYAGRMIEEMEEYLRNHFNDTDFVVGRKIISTNKRRKRSWGGSRPRSNHEAERENLSILNLYDMGYVNLALHRFTKPRGEYSHVLIEYDNIFDRPDIGTVYGHWKRCVGALVAHEMAHAYVSCSGGDLVVNGSFNHDSTMDGGHDKKWQYVYYLLREKFVNPYQEGYP